MSERTPIAIQLDIAERLRADEYFSDIKVFDEDKGAVESDIEIAIGPLTEQGGKTGVCVVVAQPIGTDEFPNVILGPLLLDLTIAVHENRLINKDIANGGTGKMAWDVAKRIFSVLKNFQSVGLTRGLHAKGPAIVGSPVRTDWVSYEVRLQTTEADAPDDDWVNNVTISPSGGAAPQTVALACATAGASVYYTLDKSYPRAGNPSATPYADPISIMAATTLRCAAYKSGSIASDVNRAIFT